MHMKKNTNDFLKRRGQREKMLLCFTWMNIKDNFGENTFFHHSKWLQTMFYLLRRFKYLQALITFKKNVGQSTDVKILCCKECQSEKKCFCFQKSIKYRMHFVMFFLVIWGLLPLKPGSKITSMPDFLQITWHKKINTDLLL